MVFTFAHLFEAFLRDLLCQHVELVVAAVGNVVVFCRLLQDELAHFVDKGGLPAFEQSEHCRCLESLAEDELVEIHLLVYVRLALFDKLLKLSRSIQFFCKAPPTQAVKKTLQKTDGLDHFHLAFQLLEQLVVLSLIH